MENLEVHFISVTCVPEKFRTAHREMMKLDGLTFYEAAESEIGRNLAVRVLHRVSDGATVYVHYFNFGRK